MPAAPHMLSHIYHFSGYCDNILNKANSGRRELVLTDRSKEQCIITGKT